MVLRLAEVLDVPLRQQNQLLMAAGLAPVYGERCLDDPDMTAVRDGVERLLSRMRFALRCTPRDWRRAYETSRSGDTI